MVIDNDDNTFTAVQPCNHRMHLKNIDYSNSLLITKTGIAERIIII